jgi:Bromodomain
MEMRVFIERLLRDRKYKAFWLPVDPVHTPDYLQIIKEPMDLSKIAAQVDKGMYPTVLAMVKDVDTMVKNAITYNPAHTEEGAAILRRAHALIDIVHAWVDNLDPELVERCNAIVTARLNGLATDAGGDDDKKSKEPISACAPAAANGDNNFADSPEQNSRTVLQGRMNRESAGGSDQGRRQSNSKLEESELAVNGAVVSPKGRVAGMNGILSGGGVSEGSEAPASDKRVETETNVMDVEVAYVDPGEHNLRRLDKSWMDVTTGLGIDALDALYVRCSSVLYVNRRSRDRRAVVEALIRTIEEARNDPSLKLVA